MLHHSVLYDASQQTKKSNKQQQQQQRRYLFPSMMSGFSGGVVEEWEELRMDSWGSGERRGEEDKKVGEARGEVERRGEEPRGEEPGTSPLSGTSSAFLLRLGAGLVALTPGGAAGSKLLPKLPAAGLGLGLAVKFTLLSCSEERSV